MIYKNTTLYDIDFPQKIGLFRFFLRKFLLSVFYIFHGTNYFFYCPKFQKWNFIKNSWYTNIQHCTTLIFLSKNWIFAIFFKKVSIDCFLYILWNILFFLLSKVSKIKLHKKSLIYKNTTLYEIDFPQEIGFLRFFLRKFLLTVFYIFYGTYYFFLLSKVSKIKLHKKSLIYKNTTLYEIDFPQEIGFLRFFLRKFLLTVFDIFHGTYYFFYRPKFQKWNIIKNPWYTTIQDCTTLIFLKKLDFCDFF